MKFTFLWLKQFLNTNATVEEISNKLTMIGLEIENINDLAQDLEYFRVAEVMNVENHPNADTLKICQVNTGNEILQVICGAPNIKPGIKVVFASVGTVIPSNKMKIKSTKIRGKDSFGMICSAAELNISSEQDKIIELPLDAIVNDTIAKYLGLDDIVIEVNVTPNRSDCLSVYGIARDLAATGIGTLTLLPKIETNETFESKIYSKVIDNDACSFYGIREIRNINNNITTPLWLQCYLNNIGIESISPIVDIVNYIMITFGQPMHVYDKSKINQTLIVSILNNSNGKNFYALDKSEYQLYSGDIVVSDKDDVQCLAGIIGGQKSACTKNTTNIILEVANFNSHFIMRTNRRLLINTESSHRFERGVDKNFAIKALNYATDLIIALCQGEASLLSFTNNKDLVSRKIAFPISYFYKITNIQLDYQQIIDILQKLGFICTNINNNTLIDIEVPTWRQDISIKEDIVEEIIRIYGYNKIPEKKLSFINQTKIIPDTHKRIIDIKRILACNGYNEVITWSFMDKNIAQLFTTTTKELTIVNPISSELNYMRPLIIANLIQVARHNINRSFKNLSLFEIGPVFFDNSQITQLAAIRTGLTTEETIYNSRSFDLFDIKADIESILLYVGIDINNCNIMQNNNIPSYFQSTRSASINLGKNIIAYFGQIHPSILRALNIKVDILALELNIDDLPIKQKEYRKKRQFISFDYQKVVRNFAFIIKDIIPVGDLITSIKNIDKTLIQSVNLFDIYIGDNIPLYHKSVAVSVIIQDRYKTLNKQEIDDLQVKIILTMQKKFDATIRDH